MTNPPAADEPAAPRYEADYLPDGGSAAGAERSDPVSTPPAAPVSAAPVSAEPASAAPASAEPAGETPVFEAPTYPLVAEAPTVAAERPEIDLTKVERDEPGSTPPPAEGFAPPAGAAPPPGSVPPGATPPGGFPPGGFPPGPPGAPPGDGPFGPPPGGNGPFGTPFGSGFTRSNLVRPQQGRYVAGVCAAIGRATNTDPTLWRVIFAVLTLAGGVSIVAYLLGWLLLPAEGDTGSPLEALLGRGRSTTSAPLAIVIGVGAVLAFLLVMSRNVGAAAVGLAVVIGVVALLVRGQGNLPPAPLGDPHGGAPPGTPLGPFVPPPAPAPAAPFPPVVPPFQAQPTPSAGAPAVHPAWLQQQTTATRPVVPPAPAPTAGPPPAPLPPLPPLAPVGYRPPFAPHGPFGGRSPYAASLGYPPGAPGSPYPGLAPVPPKPPKPPKVRSRLGRVIFSLICLSLGVLAALEVTTQDFLVSTYFAVPLTIVALGLIVGAWFGRARLMILVGVVLSIALAIATASRGEGGDGPRHIEKISLNPSTVAELDGEYRTDIGDINANLSRVDFTGEDVDLTFRVDLAGNIRIILPPNVDVTVDVRVEGGDCRVLGRPCGGFNQTNEFTDNGADGVGGGKLHLDLDVRWGNLEVTR
ncbi:PspC domain-containing protein [Dactylosporangium sp. NPDC050688]|uniref:PspC domain-containing protein n=1 Tax=Dactylosporangium sp. NPDC050688 TaxID=3157217 RepID=UPI0033D02BFD